MSQTVIETSTHEPLPPLLEALQRDGFVKVQNLISSDLLSSVQDACLNIIRIARSGEWPFVRTVPKQYPPWQLNSPGTNIWGVQHLLHPSMPNRDIYAELYFSSAILDVVKQLVGLPVSRSTDDDLVMELFNLLISPSDSTDFQLCWHRDDIKPTVSLEEEARQLAEKSPNGRQLHAQYNIALTDDDSLIVIPGSHRRARTEAERSAAPYEPHLEGQIVVSLKPGDAVFYDSNILHRGVYTGIDATREVGRMTLHGSVGLAGHGTERARQVLQHGVGEWIKDTRASFTIESSSSSLLQDDVSRRAEGMRDRLIAMGSGVNLGYSLEG